MFRGVGNNGYDDEGDPLFVDGGVFDEAVDAVDEILSGEVGDNGDNDQKKEGRGCVHAGIFDMVRGDTGCVCLDR